MELGFKEQGCPFDFGNVNWLSGMQEEADDKMTLLGSPDGEVSNAPSPKKKKAISPEKSHAQGAVEADAQRPL